MTFTGADLRKARQRAGLSHAKLARQLGVSERTLFRYEADREAPIAGPDRSRLIVRAITRFIRQHHRTDDGATS